MTAHTGGIRIENLRKVYGQGDTAVEALRNVNLHVGQPQLGLGAHQQLQRQHHRLVLFHALGHALKKAFCPLAKQCLLPGIFAVQPEQSHQHKSDAPHHPAQLQQAD